MMAFFLAILMTPSARVTVTHIGRPSGIAATARDTPKKSKGGRGGDEGVRKGNEVMSAFYILTDLIPMHRK